jgi:hypothetical protein
VRQYPESEAMMADAYNGKCPVCSGQLGLELDPLIIGDKLHSPSPTGNLVCTENSEHFKITQTMFELAWQKFDKGSMDGRGLMIVLLGGNLAPERPTLAQLLAGHQT